jgi:hypothetical protein
MAARFYRSCSQCGKRMKRVYDDGDGGRFFYVCPEGHTGILHVPRGWTEGWTPEVYDEAFSDGILEQVGKAKGESRLFRLKDWDAVSHCRTLWLAHA